MSKSFCLKTKNQKSPPIMIAQMMVGGMVYVRVSILIKQTSQKIVVQTILNLVSVINSGLRTLEKL